MAVFVDRETWLFLLAANQNQTSWLQMTSMLLWPKINPTTSVIGYLKLNSKRLIVPANQDAGAKGKKLDSLFLVSTNSSPPFLSSQKRAAVCEFSLLTKVCLKILAQLKTYIWAMVVTLKTSLPTEEELNVQEVNLSSPVLRAGAFHLGKYCEQQNNVISYFTHFAFKIAWINVYYLRHHCSLSV